MECISKAVARMIAQHEPYPGIVMDRYWNVLQTNDAALRFFGCFIDMSSRPSPRNVLHLMFDPLGMRSFIENWTAVAKSLIQRVHRESVGQIADQATQKLLAVLLAYPGTQTDWKQPQMPKALPMIPISFIKDGALMNYFSLVTTVGTAQAIVAQELRIECMYPADGKRSSYMRRSSHSPRCAQRAHETLKFEGQSLPNRSAGRLITSARCRPLVLYSKRRPPLRRPF